MEARRSLEVKSRHQKYKQEMEVKKMMILMNLYVEFKKQRRLCFMQTTDMYVHASPFGSHLCSRTLTGVSS